MKLLIVEDDLEGGLHLQESLRKAGHVPDHVLNGVQGLRLATSQAYDVIILDRLLPQLDGMAMLGAIRGMGVSTPVIMLTCVDGIEDRVGG
ncbi:MAG: DNA-binding response regulator, partial [Caulobacteraceae bacterium]|nr:DNA-binding response regulator [Caulobacteraceae bacterium]